MQATTVRSVPTITWSFSPISRTLSITWSICFWSDPAFITTIMVPPQGWLGKLDSSKRKKPQDRVLGLLFVPSGQLRARGVSAGKIPAKVKAERREGLTHRSGHIPHNHRQNQASCADLLEGHRRGVSTLADR